MKRVLVGFVALLASCKCDTVMSCGADGDCGDGNRCVEGLCVVGDAGSGGGTAGGIAGGGSGGGGVGGGAGGGAGGGQVSLASIRWVSPDGGMTNAAMLPLVVELNPSGYDAGPSLPYSLRPPTGAVSTGSVTRVQPGRYGNATTPLLTDGEWEAVVSAGGMDASVRFVVDRTPPTVTLVVENPPARVVDGGLSEVDPMPGYELAWRRDEVAELRVLADEPVNVSVSNISGVVPPAALASRTCSSACDAGQCTCFSVDVSRLTIPAPNFRHEFMLDVSGATDRAGNPSGVGSAMLKVTRWKWRKVVASGATTIPSPAIDTQGNVFVGAQVSANSGVVMGLSPTGSERFAITTHGALTTAPIVGKFLYAATKDAADGRIRQLNAATGIEINAACSGGAKTYDSPMALADLAAADERIVAVSRNGWLSAARPTAGGNTCIETMITPPTMAGQRYTTLATDLHAFSGNNFDGFLTRVPWTGNSWDTAATNAPTLDADGLALFGTTLVGGGRGTPRGGVFGMKADNSNFTLPLAATFTRMSGSAQATGPIVIGTAASPVLVYGNGSELVRITYTPGDPGSFGATATTAVMQTGQGIGTPPLAGEGGIIYVATTNGTVSAYSADLQTLLWRLTGGTTGVDGSVDSALNIDAARMIAGVGKDCGRPGTLYVPATGNGSLYAFVVDSKGIDGAAPWPRFQRDPRNTANPASSLVEFTCP